MCLWSWLLLMITSRWHHRNTKMRLPILLLSHEAFLLVFKLFFNESVLHDHLCVRNKFLWRGNSCYLFTSLKINDTTFSTRTTVLLRKLMLKSWPQTVQNIWRIPPRTLQPWPIMPMTHSLMTHSAMTHSPKALPSANDSFTNNPIQLMTHSPTIPIHQMASFMNDSILIQPMSSLTHGLVHECSPFTNESFMKTSFWLSQWPYWPMVPFTNVPHSPLTPIHQWFIHEWPILPMNHSPMTHSATSVKILPLKSYASRCNTTWPILLFSFLFFTSLQLLL